MGIKNNSVEGNRRRKRKAVAAKRGGHQFKKGVGGAIQKSVKNSKKIVFKCFV